MTEVLYLMYITSGLILINLPSAHILRIDLFPGQLQADDDLAELLAGLQQVETFFGSIEAW
jgi:hypothetical protein